MKYIDSNIWVGKRCTPTVHDVSSTKETILIMDKLGIESAIVTHFSSAEYHPSYGNEFVLNEIKENSGRIMPAWVVLPGVTGDFLKGNELKDALESNKIKMARILPTASANNFSVKRWCCEDLFDVLCDCKIPLMLDISQITWNQIEELIRTNQKLNIILSNLTYRCDRYTYPLLDKYENVFLETSGIKGYLSIEDICSRFGASRLIFGSNLPIYDGGSSIAIVEFADITNEEKEMIAYKNISVMAQI